MIARNPLLRTLAVLALSSWSLSASAISVEVTNPLDQPRNNELIQIDLEQLDPSAQVIRGDLAGYRVMRGHALLPTQLLDHDFDGQPDTLAILMNLEAGEVTTLQIEPARSLPNFEKQVHAELGLRAGHPAAEGDRTGDSGRYILMDHLIRPTGATSDDFRFEGPLIESRRIAYRIYFDERGAIDIYGKTADTFVSDAYHREQNYHSMQWWGRDLLHNGPALGLGGLGVGHSAERISPLSASHVEFMLDADGPIYAGFRILCIDVPFEGNDYDVAWDVSISAGQLALEHRVTVLEGGDLPLMAALTNHLEEGGVTTRQSIGDPAHHDFLATWGDQVFPDANPEAGAQHIEKMGMAVLWPWLQLDEIESNDLEFRVQFVPGNSVHYHSLAAYNLEGVSPMITGYEFYGYLQQLSRRLAHPVEVELP